MPTYYAKLMAEVLREMPAAEGETHPADALPVARYAVAVARESHWSLPETMRFFAEVRALNDAAQADEYAAASLLGMPAEELERFSNVMEGQP